MEDESLVGKWIAVYPKLLRTTTVTRTQVLKVVKETKEQVVAHEGSNWGYDTTIHKSRIMCVVPESDKTQIREDAKNISNEYKEKQKSLRDEYHGKMKGVVGENY